MITSLVQSLTNESTPVQILDGESFSVVFESVNPMSVSVTDEKRATRFTVETGEERNDHIVDNAIEIAIEFILTDKTQYENMRRAYTEHRLLTIQTRMRSYDNMLIEAFPHSETQSNTLGAVLPLRFIEWREITPEYGELTREQVASPAQSSTVDRGNQRGSDVAEGSETEAQGSRLYEWMN